MDLLAQYIEAKATADAAKAEADTLRDAILAKLARGEVVASGGKSAKRTEVHRNEYDVKRLLKALAAHDLAPEAYVSAIAAKVKALPDNILKHVPVSVSTSYRLTVK